MKIKPIPGYESLYTVSENGSVARVGGGQGAVRGRILTWKIHNGYAYVDLSKDDTKERFGVHRLVLMAFVGIPSEGLVCNHLDTNRLNNHVSNLEWTTQGGNVAHAVGLGLVGGRPMPGEENGRAKLTQLQVTEIRSLKGKVGARGLARRFGVSRTAIQLIHQGKNWSEWPEDLRVRQFPLQPQRDSV